MKTGRVYLVGAGPGDPKLITVKGLEAILKSDAIVYDRLASPRLLAYARPGVEKIYVGKLPDRHTMKQEEINQLLVDLALQGKTVTRLKGGDPSVFGRVGEEAHLLVQHEVPYEIIPGITSAIAVPTYAGIPVTHREYNTSFTVVTGHEKPEKLDSTINWEKVSTASDTLIFLMGVAKIEYISEQLQKNGRAASTPVALIRWGTRVEQETLVGTLADIAEKVRLANFKAPAVIIVGDVVKLREQLAWYEKLPLFGKRILVTRSREQASELVQKIDELGGEPYELPLLRLEPVSSEQEQIKMRQALGQLETYDWIVFTSVNAVEYFFDALKREGIDIRKLHRAKMVSVGPKTTEELNARGIIPEAVPDQYQQEGVWAAIATRVEKEQKVLFPKSSLSRKWLSEQMISQGLVVDEINIYEPVPCVEQADELIHLLEQKELHILSFASSSTVRHFAELLKAKGRDVKALTKGLDIACIGPITAQTAQEVGLEVNMIADEATLDSFIEVMSGQGRHIDATTS
ncbi:uroporphyrinogen-III C-methyltransferase [Marinicrinis sediminis]|uniref:uroporphyrinogen-III C-methyltransferase n=1 Tax=Marinicrinis sediminis TaxID=1652465 RepID=A0ABW5R660_9BACL